MAEDQAPELHTAPGRDVFISYASQDKAVAEAVCKALESAGLACWIAPRDVIPGESFAGAIVHAIDATKVIVLVLSEHAADSQHVLREVERATSKRHAIIAFRLDMKPLPADFEYFLNTSQWLDASAGVKRALPKLVEAVRGATAQSTSMPGAMPAPAVAPAAKRRLRSALIGAVALVLAIAAYLLIGRIPTSKPGISSPPASSTGHPSEVSEKSIAVLPFVDMSEKKDQEYFSDGLSEELIDHLTHYSDLKVIARTSSFAFKGKNEDMRKIAAMLGVANLLEGSVRKSGSRLRITAQLIRASDGIHLWSETYDRQLTDIFKLQDEISTTVASALNTSLSMSPAANIQPAPRGTANVAAYNLLLQGNYFFYRAGNGDFEAAAGRYQQAVKADPSYALAWAKAGRTIAYQGTIGDFTPSVAEPKARVAVDRALALDPRCAEAYYARGQIERIYSWNRTAASSDYERAAKLDPTGEVGLSARGHILQFKAEIDGQFRDLIDWHRRNVERNPLDTGSLNSLAGAQQNAGLLEESGASYRRLLELNSSFASAHANYAITLLRMGKNADALAEVKQEPYEPDKLGVLAEVYWALGRRADSNAALEAYKSRYGQFSAYWVAAAYAYRGEIDAAFAWLDRAYRQKEDNLSSLKVEPDFRKLRGDPRFDALLRKLKLVE